MKSTKRISVIALDIDGTCIHNNKEMSDRTHKAILECIAAGYHLIFVTGRTSNGFPVSMCDIKYNALVGANGAVLEDCHGVFSRKSMPTDTAIAILEDCQRIRAIEMVYANDIYYCNSQKYNICETDKNEQHDRVLYVDDLIKLISNNKLCPEKITFLADNTKAVLPYMKLSYRHPNTNFALSSATCLEITSIDASKKNGLLQMIRHLCIDPREIIYIGDTILDSMCFSEVGYAVAMGNSEMLVKEAADYVTETNENDGVAIVLEKLLEKGGFIA